MPLNPAPATEERPRIFGLETEHAILYIPLDEAGVGPIGSTRPPFSVLESVLFDCLLAGRRSARSSGLKGGYFLENGGLVHLEIFLRSQSDTPVLEVATPECRSPWDALEYSRAFDDLLEETSRRSRAALAEKGYRGQIAFGKNNRDPGGVGYGCHESYLIYHRQSGTDRCLTLLSSPLLFLAFFPAFLVFMLLLGVSFLFLIAFVVTAWLLGAISIPLVAWLKRLSEHLLRRRTMWIEAGRAFYIFISHALLLPGIRLYSIVLRGVAFRAFFRDLTSFLVTRQVFAGTGFLDFRGGVYELSQRPALTRSLGSIVMFGRQKTVFDLKAFLFDPLALFRDTKKLSLAVGDSNLSDIPNLLKIGTTALLLEMIEAGECFAGLRLRHPVSALKAVSRDGPWKMLPLRNGGLSNALDIQKSYLARAREFFRDRPPSRLRHDEILRLWAETLDRLSDRPSQLNDTLDWVAKKSLLDQAVLAQTNWTLFFRWGRLFDRAGLKITAQARSLVELLQLSPLLKRFRLRGQIEQDGLDPTEFSTQRDLYFQVRKLDLRFHELGCQTGYQRTLEREGLVKRLTDPTRVAHALLEPPQDTRARIRGFYIRSNSSNVLNVSWSEIELSGPIGRIALANPFWYRLPME